MLLVDDLAAGGTKNLRHTPRGLVTLVPASSGLIDKKDKIAKVKSYLFNFPSQLSPIFIHRCTKLLKLAIFFQLFGIYLFKNLEDKC